jgi:hypothetical protein
MAHRPWAFLGNSEPGVEASCDITECYYCRTAETSLQYLCRVVGVDEDNAFYYRLPSSPINLKERCQTIAVPPLLSLFFAKYSECLLVVDVASQMGGDKLFEGGNESRGGALKEDKEGRRDVFVIMMS